MKNKEASEILDESASLAKKGKNRLKVTKIAIEYLFTTDQFDNDEWCYLEIIEDNWNNFTTEMKWIFFMHIVQGMTFTNIAILRGYSQQYASKMFDKACKIIQDNI